MSHFSASHLKLLPPPPGEHDAIGLCRRIHAEALEAVIARDATSLEIRQYLQALALCVHLEGAQAWAAELLSETAPGARGSLGRQLCGAFGRILRRDTDPDLPMALAGQIVGALALAVASMSTERALADAWTLLDRIVPTADPAASHSRN